MRARRAAWPAPLVAVLLAAAAAAAAPVVQPSPSALWGVEGELWDPATGPMDFSFAGYHFGDEEPPSPPVTRQLEEFQTGGRSDTEALQAMVDWANAQPESAGWVVLGLPAREVRLDGPLAITRSYTVLQGAGANATTLAIDRSLTDVQGPNSISGGYYVYRGAFLTAQGSPGEREEVPGGQLVLPLNGSLPRGSRVLQVEDASAFKAGDIVSLVYYGGSFTLAREIMNNKADPGPRYENTTLYFSSRVASVDEATDEVTLERTIPWALREEFKPELARLRFPLREVGFEGFTIRFKWTQYIGHHKELGMSGVEFYGVQDCWARRLRFVNADNGVLVLESERVSVQDVQLEVSQPRQGPPEGPFKRRFDGHWGVRVAESRDVLLSGYRETSEPVHSFGADGRSLTSVFEDARMAAGTLEMHRGQAAQNLFTNIDVGRPVTAIYNGGPQTNGPNAGAWTTYWSIRSADGAVPPPSHSGAPRSPGNCSFGPDILLVGVPMPAGAYICPDWHLEQGEVDPQNLRRAQLQRRRARLQRGAGGAVLPRRMMHPAC